MIFRKQFYLVGFILLTFQTVCAGTDIKVSNILLGFNWESRTDPHVYFTLSWKNSWSNNTNHDAAWVFVKLSNPKGKVSHALLSKSSDHKVYSYNKNVNIKIQVAPDKVGVMIYSDRTYRGEIKCRIRLSLDPSMLNSEDFVLQTARPLIYAIEMVYIPGATYYLGDPDSTSRSYSSFYQVGETKPDYYLMKDEKSTLSIGNSRGKLYYDVKQQQYQGDQQGNIPPSFPKGVNGFYIMKYEINQGQYAGFLNSLDSGSKVKRSIHLEQGYMENKGSIELHNGSFIAKAPNRPCNYLSWSDAAAYADWAGLRPYTEMEFTKACRGSVKPISKDFPWGTDETLKLDRYINHSGDITYDATDESSLQNNNKDIVGASFYWVFDLTGSLWERVVTIGNPKGRDFAGTHGDGILSGGSATNNDWPVGGKDAAGFGYRGGGYYHPGRGYNMFNPHSAIEYRPYGSWAGDERGMAYGARFVRTAF